MELEKTFTNWYVTEQKSCNESILNILSVTTTIYLYIAPVARILSLWEVNSENHWIPSTSTLYDFSPPTFPQWWGKRTRIPYRWSPHTNRRSSPMPCWPFPHKQANSFIYDDGNIRVLLESCQRSQNPRDRARLIHFPICTSSWFPENSKEGPVILWQSPSDS